MKRKYLAVFMAMLMSATVIASISTVTAHDPGWMKEIQDHVTPDQWIEIQELIKKGEEAKAKPDLEIIDFDMGANEILWAEIYNSGNAYSPAFDVRFHVWYSSQWKAIGRDIVWLGLTIGNTVWTNADSCPYTGTLYSRAYVDMYDNIDEEDDTNNDDYEYFTFT